MREKAGPYPAPGWRKRIATEIQTPLAYAFSGELKANLYNATMGAATKNGLVKNVFLTVLNCGRDDSNPLQVTGEVYINGTTCLSTKPSIGGNASTAGTQKSSFDGVASTTAAVVSSSANTFVKGDVFTCSLTLVRTASPTTEIRNPVVVVELEPDT